MKAVRVHAVGGPEAMTLDDVAIPCAGAGQLVVRVEFAGINFIDTYQRSGLYPVGEAPFTLGKEGAGIVHHVGQGVHEFSVGDRVSWANVQGSYANFVLADPKELVLVPDGVELRVAAALGLQGMTAHYLATSTYPIKPGDNVLIHAGAGGTGALLIQVAKLRGANIITTVSNEEKAKIARAAGADHVILYTKEDFCKETLRLTDLKGVQVAYDSVGLSTWEKSLQSVARCGMLVLFGNASGPVPPINPLMLSKQGSICLCRPKLGDYIVERSELERRMAELYAWILDGKLRVDIGAVLPLDQVRNAHELLEGRKTTGKILLQTSNL